MSKSCEDDNEIKCSNNWLTCKKTLHHECDILCYHCAKMFAKCEKEYDFISDKKFNQDYVYGIEHILKCISPERKKYLGSKLFKLLAETKENSIRDMFISFTEFNVNSVLISFSTEEQKWLDAISRCKTDKDMIYFATLPQNVTSDDVYSAALNLLKFKDNHRMFVSHIYTILKSKQE